MERMNVLKWFSFVITLENEVWGGKPVNKGEFANALSLSTLPNGYVRSEHPLSINKQI